MRLFILNIIFLNVLNLHGQIGNVFEMASPAKPIHLKQNMDSVVRQNINGKSFYLFSYKFSKEFDDITLPNPLHSGKWLGFFKDDSTKKALLVTYKKKSPRKATVYYFNGKPKEKYRFKNNLIDGLCNLYYPSGNIYAIVKFKDGELDKNYSKFWNDDGSRR